MTPRGRQKTVTAPLGGVATTYYETCCGFTTGSRNALGHGSVTNANAIGQTIHTATLADYDSHSNLLNPLDSKTMGENTSRYDDLGRMIYQTRWKSAIGVIDRNNPPIAGVGSIPLSGGVTTQRLYDNIVGDGVGLDSAAGVTISKLSGAVPMSPLRPQSTNWQSQQPTAERRFHGLPVPRGKPPFPSAPMRKR